MKHIPIGEARELSFEEAMRALFDDFKVLESEPTEPMPLQLEVDADEQFRAQVRRVIRGEAP